jgi:hypothetical protein
VASCGNEGRAEGGAEGGTEGEGSAEGGQRDDSVAIAAFQAAW